MKQLRILYMSVVFLALFLTLSAGIALPAHAASRTSARSAMPESTFNCNNNYCFADQTWYGNTFGASVQFTVDKPPFTNSGTNAFYNKYMFLQGLVGGQRTLVGLAVTKGNSFPSDSNYCGGSVSSVKFSYFLYTWDVNGINVSAKCYPASTGDINKLVKITVNTWDCEGDGLNDDVDLQISAYVSHWGDCVEAEEGGYGSIDDKMQFYGTVNNHSVYGGHWYNSSWVDSSYNVRGQTRLPDTSDENQPPQQYWNTIPSNNLPGGDLYSCVYATGVLCYPGA